MSRLQTNAIRHLGSTVDNLTLDNAGRVLMASQPMFSVYGTATGVAVPASSSVILPYNQATTNIGGCYNTSTYRFTAPVSGKYHFMASYLHYPNNANGYTSLYLYVNGGNVNLMNRSTPLSQTSVAVSGHLYLNAGDYVDARIEAQASTTTSYYLASGHAVFTGHLIG